MTSVSPPAQARASVGVVLVDPHTKVRAVLEDVLAAEAGITVIAAVATFDEALVVFRRLRPRVALVDVGALGERGLTGLSELHAARPHTAILAMGVVADPALDRAAVRHGAVGRVLKDTPAPELAAAVRVAAGRARALRLVPPEA
jgi:DNA-binding NarL/FixJ family response regulator